MAELRTKPCYQIEEVKIFNILFPRVEIKLTFCRVYNHMLVPLRHDRPNKITLVIYICHQCFTKRNQLSEKCELRSPSARSEMTRSAERTVP